uniref:Uncharacterized protein n=1 Tax=Octopus bimaculoides TaxID=37653 RepID=A0A0L8GQT7_OCTBM
MANRYCQSSFTNPTSVVNDFNIRKGRPILDLNSKIGMLEISSIGSKFLFGLNVRHFYSLRCVHYVPSEECINVVIRSWKLVVVHVVP